MPNRILFNDTAENMQVQVFGSNEGDIQPLKVDASGNLLVNGTIAGQVTIDTTTIPLNVAATEALPVKVEGDVTIDTTTPLNVVASADAPLPVMVAKRETVSVGPDNFTGNGTDVMTAAEDVLALSDYTYFIRHEGLLGAAPIKVQVQISPDKDNDALWVNSPDVAVEIPVGGNGVVVSEFYLQYIRLLITDLVNDSTATVYFQGQY